MSDSHEPRPTGAADQDNEPVPSPTPARSSHGPGPEASYVQPRTFLLPDRTRTPIRDRDHTSGGSPAPQVVRRKELSQVDKDQMKGLVCSPSAFLVALEFIRSERSRSGSTKFCDDHIR